MSDMASELIISQQDATIAQLRAEVERLTEEADKAVRDLCRWRSAFQDVTPGGSEFMSPEAVIEWARRLKSETHEAKVEKSKSMKRADKAEAALAKVREVAWLIEWPQDDQTPYARFWHPVHGWCWDATKALRFSREEDASAYIGSQRGLSGKPTEHVFLASLTEGDGE